MRLRRQDIDTLLDAGYVNGLELADVGEVRRRRDECQRAEVVVSYLRRVIQGELDLVMAEMELRSSGARGDSSRLVEELPVILSTSRSPASGRSEEATVGRDVPPEPSHDRGWQGIDDVMLEDVVEDALNSELAGTGIVGGVLPGANLGSFTDAELAELVDRMRDDEANLSAQRRQLHERIDLLQAGIIERYKTGAADPDALLEPVDGSASRQAEGGEGSSA